MDVPGLEDTPVLLLASTELRSPEGSETVADVRKWRVVYLAYLNSLRNKSSRGTGPIEIPNSSHSSMVLGERQAETTAQAIISFAARI
jgi:hypothetical protein